MVSAVLPGWGFLWSKRWLGYTILLILFAAICVVLAGWQFDRRAEATAELQRIDENYNSAAVDLEIAVPDPRRFDVDALQWQPVRVTGEYFGDPYLARGRLGPHGQGSHLLQPLRTEQGAVFIVDRGWVPVSGNEANDSGSWLKSVLSAPAGQVEVQVRLRASERDISGRIADGRTIGSVNPAQIARLGAYGDPVYTQTYGMLISESPRADHGVLPAEPERDEGPHLSYALQWYVFILIATVGTIHAARREYKDLNAGSSKVELQNARAAARRGRRGESDAEEEDAYLDR